MKTNKLMSLLLAMALVVLMLGGAAADQAAYGPNVVGEVTVTAQFTVNLRSGNSTEYSILTTPRPRQLFPTTGQTDSGS